MINIIYITLFVLGLPFLIFSAYYWILSCFGFKKVITYPNIQPKHRFAALIAARNEEQVIGSLIDTLKNQNYPSHLIDIYVIPNNCTDATEAVAKVHGAKIFTCKSPVSSKGGALEQYFDYALENSCDYDAFCIFDADNLVDPNFFSAMNNALESGVALAQGCRNSKNPKDSWISGSHSIYYWALNRFLNRSKTTIALSAAINGTGFMVTPSILKEYGFSTFSLTEDIEFTTQSILNGYVVAWVPEAITYDEHPEQFNISWKQRRRWSSGTVQCFNHYGPILWKKFKESKNMLYFDMLIYLGTPLGQVLSTIYSICTLVIMCHISINSQAISTPLIFTLLSVVLGIVLSVIVSMIVVKIEGHKIRQVNFNAYLYFWLFLTSWAVINFLCLVNPISTWEPIEHKKSLQLSDIQSNHQNKSK